MDNQYEVMWTEDLESSNDLKFLETSTYEKVLHDSNVPPVFPILNESDIDFLIQELENAPLPNHLTWQILDNTIEKEQFNIPMFDEPEPEEFYYDHLLFIDGTTNEVITKQNLRKIISANQDITIEISLRTLNEIIKKNLEQRQSF